MLTQSNVNNVSKLVQSWTFDPGPARAGARRGLALDLKVRRSWWMAWCMRRGYAGCVHSAIDDFKGALPASPIFW